MRIYMNNIDSLKETSNTKYHEFLKYFEIKQGELPRDGGYHEVRISKSIIEGGIIKDE